MMVKYILVMAAVTYIIRMLPMVLFKRRIESKFVQSFLHYVPYAVLGAMTFPGVLSSTSSLYSAIAGTVVAVILSLMEKSLILVALSACITVYAVEWLLRII